jgi:hypothetical protein
MEVLRQYGAVNRMRCAQKTIKKAVVAVIHNSTPVLSRRTQQPRPKPPGLLGSLCIREALPEVAASRIGAYSGSRHDITNDTPNRHRARPLARFLPLLGPAAYLKKGRQSKCDF